MNFSASELNTIERFCWTELDFNVLLCFSLILDDSGSRIPDEHVLIFDSVVTVVVVTVSMSS